MKLLNPKNHKTKTENLLQFNLFGVETLLD